MPSSPKGFLSRLAQRVPGAARVAAVARAIRGDTPYVPPPTPSGSAQATGPQPGSTGFRVQPGTGDTPGPNNKEDIDPIWLSAQIRAGVPPVVFDLRAREVYLESTIPGARIMNPLSLLQHLDMLPARQDGVVLFDEDGLGESSTAAAALRREGWLGARRLVGGFRAWQDQGEPTTQPSQGREQNEA